MKIDDLRTDVLELLRREGRVTFVALRRRFDLDERELTLLKEALALAEPRIVELDGPGLVLASSGSAGASPDESHFQVLLLAATALLQRDERVSFRTFRHVLGTNDACIEALRAELCFRALAHDEGGQGLVWAGTRPAVASGAAHRDVPAPRAPESSSRATPGASEAERRQLTVMFCDLVGSTDLSGRLDPEDLRDVVRAYQETAAAAIQRYGGHIAQYLGDGLLVYFGYPNAHEDDAHRAVHTAMGIVEGLGALNARLTRDHGVKIAVRLGIHTGPVVVGQMGGGGRHEHLALGETPNIAARLEGLAGANGVVISPITARLVGDSFILEPMGPQTLKGLATPMETFRVQGRRDHLRESLLAPAAGTAVLLVGREEESGLLRRRWEQSRTGQGQVVLVSGEAGIGKSVLVESLRAVARAEGAPRVTFRCSPYHADSALHCVISYLERVLDFAPDDSPEVKMDKLTAGLAPSGLPLAEVTPLFAGLLSIPDEREPRPTLTPEQWKQQTLEVVLSWLSALAERQPLLVTWEDLHWADPTTLELIGMALKEAPTVPVLHVLTHRPMFNPPWGPQSHVTPIGLARLERPQVEALIAQCAKHKPLPPEVVEHIVAKTDGVPLYVEELTLMLLGCPLLREEADRYVLVGPLGTATVPETLQDALMARLDQFKMAKEVAQLGAVVGREFAYSVLQAIGARDELALQEGLVQLVKSELLHQRGRGPRAKYVFKHALLQDAAYASLLKSSRQQYHQRIAEVLETHFPETAATQPELLAHHYGACGSAEKAVQYFTLAGQRAARQSANQEAVHHLTSALTWLHHLPDDEARARRELALQLALGASMMASKGFSAGEVEKTYVRAQELCTLAGEPLQVAQVLFGRWAPNAARGDLKATLTLAEEFLSIAERHRHATVSVVVHSVLGGTLMWRGAFLRAQEHLEGARIAREAGHHRDLPFLVGQDPGLMALGYAAETLWCLGYPDQALARVQETLKLAEGLEHPFSLVAALRAVSFVQLFCRNGEAGHAAAHRLAALSETHRFPWWSAVGACLQGWAAVEKPAASRELSEAGLQQLQSGLAAVRAMGAEVFVPRLMGALAESLARAGEPEAGLAAVAEALAMVERNEERWNEAELHRIKGELALQLGRPAEAEVCLLRAIDIAQKQHARSLELRATSCLARLWHQQGKSREAHRALSEVHGWFREGFETHDLQQATVLIAELAAAR